MQIISNIQLRVPLHLKQHQARTTCLSAERSSLFGEQAQNPTPGISGFAEGEVGRWRELHVGQTLFEGFGADGPVEETHFFRDVREPVDKIALGFEELVAAEFGGVEHVFLPFLVEGGGDGLDLKLFDPFLHFVLGVGFEHVDD